MPREDADPIRLLDEEWKQPHLRRQFVQAWPRWTSKEPALACSSVDDVEERLRDPAASPADYDALLGALLRVGQGEPLALRLVLQLYLPCLKGMVGPHPPLEDREWIALLVATAFEQISTYPIERSPCNIAPRLARRIRRSAYSTLRQLRRDHSELATQPVAGQTVELRSKDTAEFLGSSDLVRWAITHDVLSESAARLIQLTRIEGRTVTEVADRFCASPFTLWQRRWRAERRLAEALASEMD